MLEPGWYTYWRDPGESGVPPVFDFSGSVNVASVTVRYPVPERHEDGTSVSLIYPDEVVFLLDIQPADPARPLELVLDASFGICRDICIPTRGRSTIEASRPAPADPLTVARLKKFRPRLPGPPEPGTFDIESAVVEGDALMIDVRMPDADGADLFSRAPEGWFVAQPRFVSRADGVSRYRLPLAGRPADASDPRQHVPVRGGVGQQSCRAHAGNPLGLPRSSLHQNSGVFP